MMKLSFSVTWVDQRILPVFISMATMASAPLVGSSV
jgi:hypothetical protein